MYGSHYSTLPLQDTMDAYYKISFGTPHDNK